ncbi:MAG: 50S ribosomal protein L19e [Candidatus Micrarchaeota archaeon]
MSVKTVRRLAADILGVGQSRVKINPLQIKRAEEALTRKDVEHLIGDGVLVKLPISGRKTKEKKKNRKAKGEGNRRGERSTERKRRWMQTVRSQRKYLLELLDSKSIDRKVRRSMYGKVKSGLFKSKKSLYTYLKENHMLNEKLAE